jgi:hypothetical protein
MEMIMFFTCKQGQHISYLAGAKGSTWGLGNRVKITLRYVTENLWTWSLAYKSTLEKQYFIVSEPKGEIISSKID